MNQSDGDNQPPRRKKKKMDSKVLPEMQTVSCESDRRGFPIDEGPCDCCRKNCPGCFYPCESCGSVKCGVQCRIGRPWMYESLIIQGK